MVNKINFPTSRFSIILGLFGFGKMWVLISDYLNIPKNFGEIVLIIVALIWLLFILIYSLKTIFAFEKVVEEIKNPIQNNFIGLIGVATLLISTIIKPYSLMIGEILFFVGIIFQLFYGVYTTQNKWVSQQEFNYITPALYLPTVAGNFVSALACGIFGYSDLGYLFFGMGIFFWLSVESIVMNRLYKFKLEEEYQNTLGIMMAPPAIAALSWMRL
jgi:tellurite resistance protein